MSTLALVHAAIFCTVQTWERSTPARRDLFASYATWNAEPYEQTPFYPLYWMLHVARHA